MQTLSCWAERERERVHIAGNQKLERTNVKTNEMAMASDKLETPEILAYFRVQAPFSRTEENRI
jgi:hypothetical protein